MAGVTSTSRPPGGNVVHVNPPIGTDGPLATEYGGMVPGTAPPFAMTRWTPTTRENTPTSRHLCSRRRRTTGRKWNPDTGFIQARNLDGSWAEDGWTEGTTWPYLFGALHDIRGLRDLKGVDHLGRVGRLTRTASWAQVGSGVGGHAQPIARKVPVPSWAYT